MITVSLGVGSNGAALLMVAFLLLILLQQIFYYRLGQAAHNWYTVTATLLECHVKFREDEGVEESLPHIKYRYRFKGRDFVRKRLQYGDLWSSDYAESSAMLCHLHTGATINVLINPKNPRQSVFLPGYHGNFKINVMILLAGILALVVFF